MFDLHHPIVQILFGDINWGKNKETHTGNTPGCHASCSCTGQSERKQSLCTSPHLLQADLLQFPDYAVCKLWFHWDCNLKETPQKKHVIECKTSVQVMQERQNALHNQHLRLTINISHWPRVNVQLGQVFRVQSELHIDGLPVRL